MECCRGISILGIKLLAIREIDSIFYWSVKCPGCLMIRNRNSHIPGYRIHQFYWLYFILSYLQLGNSYNHIPIVNGIRTAIKLISVIDLSTNFSKFLPANAFLLFPVIRIPKFYFCTLSFSCFQCPSLLFDLRKCTPSGILISFYHGCQQQRKVIASMVNCLGNRIIWSFRNSTPFFSPVQFFFFQNM